jgi:hypothetical protein
MMRARQEKAHAEEAGALAGAAASAQDLLISQQESEEQARQRLWLDEGAATHAPTPRLCTLTAFSTVPEALHARSCYRRTMQLASKIGLPSSIVADTNEPTPSPTPAPPTPQPTPGPTPTPPTPAPSASPTHMPSGAPTLEPTRQPEAEAKKEGDMSMMAAMASRLAGWGL